MTQISPEHLTNFRELYKTHFGVELSDGETQDYAQELCGYVKMLVLPNRETLGKKH